MLEEAGVGGGNFLEDTGREGFVSCSSVRKTVIGPRLLPAESGIHFSLGRLPWAFFLSTGRCLYKLRSELDGYYPTFIAVIILGLPRKDAASTSRASHAPTGLLPFAISARCVFSYYKL